VSEPQTVNIGLVVGNTGDMVGTWATLCTNPDYVAIDGYLGGIQTISAGSTPITLTSPAAYTPTPSGGPTQAQNAVIRVTGTLTAGVQITLPLPGYMIIENLTTGAFVLSFRAIGSGEVIAIQQGSIRHIYNDGTNVRFVNLPDVGTYLDIAASTVPTWITSCTKPPYLNCDGTTFNASTYPYLNTFLGGNTLPDLRGVARYTLNQGTGRLTTAGSGLDGNTLFANKFTQSYTIVVSNLPPYTPSGNVATTFPGASFAPIFGGGGTTNGLSLGGNTNLSSTFTGAAQGGTSTPFGVVGPGTVSGITLIRAA
jgi:hypothetical protein